MEVGAIIARLARIVLLLSWAFSIPAAWSQDTAIPLIIGRAIPMIAPAVDAAGRSVVFGSAIAPDGTPFATVDIYVVGADGDGLRRLTKLAGGLRPPQGATAVSLAPDGVWASFSALATGRDGRIAEEIHLLDVTGGADRTLVVDTQGCIQPLCTNCFLACVQTPHIATDGSAVLYAVRRQRPFYVVKSDGSKPQNLPVFTGSLAPSPQRVISRNGQVVFSFERALRAHPGRRSGRHLPDEP